MTSPLDAGDDVSETLGAGLKKLLFAFVESLLEDATHSIGGDDARKTQKDLLLNAMLTLKTMTSQLIGEQEVASG